uniref:EGF-like domain-containing protein n=1 Tax=Romanomermis culicivorax TaxID=13658 RepID=A0A915L2B0_ROMCU
MEKLRLGGRKRFLWYCRRKAISPIPISLSSCFQKSCTNRVKSRNFDSVGKIDDCQFRPCHNGGTCMDKIDGFECRCTKGFMGSRCHLPCQDSYKMCKKWKDENKCSSDSRFYKSACPASCNVCVFDNSTVSYYFIQPYQTLQLPPASSHCTSSWANGSVVINNDHPSEKSFRVGLITMTTNDSITMGSIFTMGSDGVIISEQGELGYLRLELTPFFVDAPKELEGKMPTMSN